MTLKKFLANSKFWTTDVEVWLKKWVLILSDKKIAWTLAIICLSFFIIYIGKSASSMYSTPFNEFDEAHRAENAKQMKEYGSLLVPLSGSPFDRNINYRIQNKNDPFDYLYYHIERPPLVYAMMVGSVTMFGSAEWAYRLPSFIFGLLIFALFWFFAYKIVKAPLIEAFFAAIVCLMTSTDLWLSSQYAQLDTAITFGLSAACLSLIYFCQSRIQRYLYISAIAFGIAILSKGQPAVILVLPVLYLCFIRKLDWRDLLKFSLTTLAVILPWVGYLCWKFGIAAVVEIFFGFAVSSAAISDANHLAPVFWYVRWWWLTMRPGWSIFLVLVMIDLIKRTLDWRKITILIYVLGSLALLSIPSNKLWWYVLPLVPAVAFYIFLALNDWLRKPGALLSLSLSILLLSRLPSDVSNRISVAYGLAYTVMVIYIMVGLRPALGSIPLHSRIAGLFTVRTIFALSLLFSLVTFTIKFPHIIPYDWGIKPTANHYLELESPKCLWIYDMPPESALFYSNAGEVRVLTESDKLFGHCQNYLMTSTELCIGTAIYESGNMKLYNLDEGYQVKCSDEISPPTDRMREFSNKK